MPFMGFKLPNSISNELPNERNTDWVILRGPFPDRLNRMEKYVEKDFSNNFFVIRKSNMIYDQDQSCLICQILIEFFSSRKFFGTKL